MDSNQIAIYSHKCGFPENISASFEFTVAFNVGISYTF
jgi:hypothetical protein